MTARVVGGHRARWRLRLEVLTIFVMLVTSTTLLVLALSARGAAPPPVGGALAIPDAPVSLAGAQLRGDLQAPVVLIEFSAYDCGFCRRFDDETLPHILRNYVDRGLVLYGLRHFAASPQAGLAASAASCGGSAGSFWSLHSTLLAGAVPFDSEGVQSLAEQFSLDYTSYLECIPHVLAVHRLLLVRARSVRGGVQLLPDRVVANSVALYAE